MDFWLGINGFIVRESGFVALNSVLERKRIPILKAEDS
jgi:hypothetical protein